MPRVFRSQSLLADCQLFAVFPYRQQKKLSLVRRSKLQPNDLTMQIGQVATNRQDSRPVSFQELLCRMKGMVDILERRWFSLLNGTTQASAATLFRVRFSMTNTSRRSIVFGSLGLVIAGAMPWWSNRLSAAPPENVEEPVGLVWFLGTVEQVVDGVALIDFGEVQTLRQGSIVAAIRYRDNHFSPLGVLEVRVSHPTWCQTDKPRSFVPEIGDLVMFAELPGDLGSGDKIRDGFIRHRIVANANNNRYSTMRDWIEADTLQRMIEKQPDWVKGKRRIAGVIRSPSFPREMHSKIRPFMNQILMFQDYEDRGVNLAQITPKPWQEVLDELRPRTALADTELQEVDADAAVEPIATENTVDESQLLKVRREVDESMYQRPPEERNTIAVICATLLYTKTSNERQWIGQQLSRSQFPALSAQEQTLIDMEAIMRLVRKVE